MKHRIRIAGLVTRGASVLLVKHVMHGSEWWVPPGGVIEGEESIEDCVRREVWEETGLAFVPGKIAYVRQYIERATDTHHLELFFAGTTSGEEPSPRNLQGTGAPDEHVIKEVRFVPRPELGRVTLYPEELRTSFWDDLAAGFPQTRYLGVTY